MTIDCHSCLLSPLVNSVEDDASLAILMDPMIEAGTLVIVVLNNNGATSSASYVQVYLAASISTFLGANSFNSQCTHFMIYDHETGIRHD